ncbi:MAG: imidazoleglycerol-phosphate dehydratase HisB [Desulfamplus sp.]|nr:imidazoleglycerol-phosphate dehydratase HisB [Desulfamplus sp.]MBF0413955.1 imidazoleglycerol-phosphate dehydratase HisB [Desulfamplus sp.]
MARTASVKRRTKETNIDAEITLEGSGKGDISTGIPFFDHMLTLFTVHGFFDLRLKAVGDLDVDFHHTVEDIGLVLGQVISTALGDRKGICRYGEGAVPMDEAFSRVNVDMSNRPFLIYNLPQTIRSSGAFDAYLAKEFFRALSVQSGMNLHINALYGENEHHILESIFKALGRALKVACSIDSQIKGILSSKGIL